jgi:hypothetical protein
MSEGTRLQNRRNSRLFDFEAMNLKFVPSVSYFPNGAIAEIFIDEKARCGSTIGILCKDLAVTFSLAAQYGVPVDVIRRALCRDAAGNASGPLAAALDAIFADEAKHVD